MMDVNITNPGVYIAAALAVALVLLMVGYAIWERWVEARDRDA